MLQDFQISNISYVLIFSDFQDLPRFHHRKVQLFGKRWEKLIVLGPPVLENTTKIILKCLISGSFQFF